jgi:hypothetical protein
MSCDMTDVAKLLRDWGKDDMARFVIHVANTARDATLEVRRLRARIDELCPPQPVVIEERVRYTPPPEASD